MARDPAFSPQPFETFARAYLRSGDSLAADRIISAQQRLEWLRVFHGSRAKAKEHPRMAPAVSGATAFVFTAFALWAVRPVEQWNVDPIFAMRTTTLIFVALSLLVWAALRAWPFMLLGAGMLFDLMFRFGLKPGRAIFTLVVCLIVGTLGTIAMGDEILPVRRQHPAPIAKGPARPETAAREWGHIELPTHAEAEGCNVVNKSIVDRALYAFDVFVPLLDVRQECAFSIEPTAYFVRALKTTYAVLGWIVVSLTLLTISGVLRRYLEK